MIRFLPSTREAFEVELNKASLAEAMGYNEVPEKVPYMGLRGWSSGRYKTDFFWVRINEFHKYGLLPKAFVESIDQQGDEIKLSGFIGFSAFSKMVLYFWLFLALAGTLALGFELTKFYGTGTKQIEILFNGEPTLINVFPEFVAFCIVWFLAFIVFPATITSFGWRKTKRLLPGLLAMHLKNNS